MAFARSTHIKILGVIEVTCSDGVPLDQQGIDLYGVVINSDMGSDTVASFMETALNMHWVAPMEVDGFDSPFFFITRSGRKHLRRQRYKQDPESFKRSPSHEREALAYSCSCGYCGFCWGLV